MILKSIAHTHFSMLILILNHFNLMFFSMRTQTYEHESQPLKLLLARLASKNNQMSNPETKQPVLKTVTLNNNKFEIPPRYELTGMIGQGAYGIVVYVVVFFIVIIIKLDLPLTPKRNKKLLLKKFSTCLNKTENTKNVFYVK